MHFCCLTLICYRRRRCHYCRCHGLSFHSPLCFSKDIIAFPNSRNSHFRWLTFIAVMLAVVRVDFWLLSPDSWHLTTTVVNVLLLNINITLRKYFTVLVAVVVSFCQWWPKFCHLSCPLWPQKWSDTWFVAI